MEGPTLFPELNEVLTVFVAGVCDALGENLCGIYLQGSFATGDADEHSDVDFIVVTNGELGREDPAALEAVQERVYALRKWDESLVDRSFDWSRRFQGHLVLAMCRILHTLHCGRVTSKREAGEWALDALDGEWRDLSQRALDDRPDPWAKVHEQSDRVLLARSYAFVDYALSRARS